MATVIANETVQNSVSGWEVIQNENPITSTREHGYFKVGEKKESNLLEMKKLISPDEIESLIEDFLASGERIEIVAVSSDMNVSEARQLFSSKCLELSKWSPNYRRVIVREFDDVLYLARRAFWSTAKRSSTKSLPFEYTPELEYETEIGFKLRIQNENEREIKIPLEHMSELTEEQREEIRIWEENETMTQQWEMASQVISVS
jgi:hypothetical protein